MRFLLLFLLAVISANSATYYVATNGVDTNPGSVGSPFLTIQKGVTTANAGDTVLAAAGTYNENVTTARNGSSGSRIIIDGQGVATVKQVYLNHTYIHLQNFTITGVTNYYSRLIYFDRGGSFCVVSNNIIDAAGALYVYGIQWQAGATPPFGSPVAGNVLVISNTIKRVDGYIMIANYGDFNVFHGNSLIDSEQADCFNIFGRSNIYSGNICSNFPANANLANHSDWIQTFGNNGYGSQYITIVSNTVIGVPDGGDTQIALNQLSSVLITEISDWTIERNLIMNIGIAGSCSVPNTKYINNTFVRCDWFNEGQVMTITSREYDGSSTYSGLPGTDYPNGGEVRNNVFFNCGDTNGINRLITGWYAFGTDLTNISANYNFVCKTNYSAVTTNALQQSIGDAGGWNQFAWWEDNGINSGNPVFVNEAENDFRLAAGSPLIGAASDGGDIGAFDYQSSTTYRGFSFGSGVKLIGAGSIRQ